MNSLRDALNLPPTRGYGEAPIPLAKDDEVTSALHRLRNASGETQDAECRTLRLDDREQLDAYAVRMASSAVRLGDVEPLRLAFFALELATRGYPAPVVEAGPLIPDAARRLGIDVPLLYEELANLATGGLREWAMRVASGEDVRPIEASRFRAGADADGFRYRYYDSPISITKDKTYKLFARDINASVREALTSPEEPAVKESRLLPRARLDWHVAMAIYALEAGERGEGCPLALPDLIAYVDAYNHDLPLGIEIALALRYLRQRGWLTEDRGKFGITPEGRAAITEAIGRGHSDRVEAVEALRAWFVSHGPPSFPGGKPPRNALQDRIDRLTKGGYVVEPASQSRGAHDVTLVRGGVRLSFLDDPGGPLLQVAPAHVGAQPFSVAQWRSLLEDKPMWELSEQSDEEEDLFVTQNHARIETLGDISQWIQSSGTMMRRYDEWVDRVSYHGPSPNTDAATKPGEGMPQQLQALRRDLVERQDFSETWEGSPGGSTGWQRHLLRRGRLLVKLDDDASFWQVGIGVHPHRSDAYPPNVWKAALGDTDVVVEDDHPMDDRGVDAWHAAHCAWVQANIDRIEQKARGWRGWLLRLRVAQLHSSFTARRYAGIISRAGRSASWRRPATIGGISLAGGVILVLLGVHLDSRITLSGARVPILLGFGFLGVAVWRALRSRA